ncbi:MAG: hypothetical protein GEV10_14855 [Streptosporangiales bacterium]|nr:hypothetical protein [Streptosporangiales bacterium]
MAHGGHVCRRTGTTVGRWSCGSAKTWASRPNPSASIADWPDAEAVAILRRVAGGRVVLVERIPRVDDDHDLAFDLQMYTMFGGGERSRHEFAALAERAGLRVDSVTEVRDGLYLIEACDGAATIG